MSLIHYAIGKLAASRLGFALIKAYAFRTPHAHLYDKAEDGGQGPLYMGRWRVVDEGTLGGKLLKLLTGYESVRLHHIARPDHDRDLHNHPFDYRTFILDGFYSEVYEGPCSTLEEDQLGLHWQPIEAHRFVYRGQTATGSEDKFHRIDQVSVGGVWTLFCMTKNKDTWGFKVNGFLVDSVRYFIRNGHTREAIRGSQRNRSAWTD